MNEARVLRLYLHNQPVGYLVGYRSGRNVLVFEEAFRKDPARATFSLITHPQFPSSERLLQRPWTATQRLHPVLSNLLPEGALRELLAQGLKVHTDNEFALFAHLGRDLPGALVALPVAPDEVPVFVLAAHGPTFTGEYSAG
jgi:serine/threonine-protein kinase HipA